MRQEERVLVTGGSGFLGGALIRQLVAGGTPVRALARDSRAMAKVAELGAEPVLGDLVAPETLGPALEGVGLVFNLGGVNSLCPQDPRRLFEVNVGGAANLVRAASASGIRRLVHTSSAATLGERRGEVGTEWSSHRGWFLSAYERSKYDAERVVLRLSEQLGLEAVCVNPASVQGPGRTTGTARWLIRYANGRLRWLVDTRVSLVDISDCTKAHLLAAERGQPGQRYLISGSTSQISQLTSIVARVTGRSYPVRMVPPTPAMGAVFLAEQGFRLAGRRPPICREMIRTLLHGHAYDGSRAAAELGFSYTPLEVTVEQALRWYAANGHLHDTDWLSNR